MLGRLEGLPSALRSADLVANAAFRGESREVEGEPVEYRHEWRCALRLSGHSAPVAVLRA